MKKKKKPSLPHPARLRFPEDEAKQPWLGMLLDAYALTDEGVAAAIRREKRIRGRSPACSEGCSHCCRFLADIAVYPVELVGISWYAVEKTGGEVRAVLERQLSSYDLKSPCPFLVQDRCAIYPVRPMACRQFNVFSRPCRPGEDPYFTRKEDLLMPVQDYLDRALSALLPFFGVEGAEEGKKAVRSGALHTLLQNFLECNWKSLSRRLADYESPPSPGEKKTGGENAG